MDIEKLQLLEAIKIRLIHIEGDDALMGDIRPLLTGLIGSLILLPDGFSKAQCLFLFEQCLLAINIFEEEIETVERESILKVIYEIGEVVGLASESQFAEEWRGDW